MAKCKTPPTTPGEQIAQQILNNYDIKSAEDVQDVLKQIFGPIFESMLKGEMENHLGHKKHERSEDGDNVRNGYSSKTLKTSLGEVPIRVPRDRQSTFEPQIIKKHQRDVSSIEGKVLAMYARGMSQRDIAATIEDIYGFQMSHEQISTITGCVMEEVEAWRNRPLQSFYPFAFVDCIYVSLRTEYGVQQVAVYVMLAYDVNGCKDVLGLWINETESKHAWMQIFDELRARGVKDLGILSMDGVSGLEEGAKAVFPHATVQRCIVHLIRNSIRYIPRKQWSAFTKQLKLIYGAINVKQARQEFEKFKTDWQAYPGAVSVWENNFSHVEQLYNYGSAVRKIMYTTNAIESVNSTRTRTSFEVGVYQLGGLGNYMNAATELQSGRGEPLKDTARVLGRYYDCVVWRTYRQCDLEEFAELAGVPVINGLTDYAHPCQVLADLMTIRERRGTLEGQKLCFIGDGCSMANSLIVGGLLAGMRVTCVCPEGYRPAADVLMFAHKYGEKFHLLTDPAEGVKDADVVVTAAWNTAPGTPESERRLRDFAGFQVTSRLMEGAKPDAMLLHCLPAHRGEEISTAVFEEHADEIFDEAENRLHVQKAVLAILLAGL